ncbi:MAG: nicotinate-nucleotide--dimethylbenzimidazole phosphoribosyltransferase [Gammaproteobacteria bacterium]|nr:nicotinate-nucleotide--dimethylbenzimidazole phosphoribosyltransferase [Gammaproteobacteria bacterium]
MLNSSVAALIASITPVSNQQSLRIQTIIDQKTKPLGSLGQLENLALQLAQVLGDEPLQIKRPQMLIFAADHGIAAEGISIAPSDVTTQMVNNFLAGGAAINCFCQTNEIELHVIDAGIATEIKHPRLIQQAIVRGTKNFCQQPAMTKAQANQCLALGAAIASEILDQGSNVIGFGEMGIGNSSSAAAMMAAILKVPADECVGRGTGISDHVLSKKLAIIESALRLHAENLTSPLEILSAVGGFEIGQIAGAMLAVAAQKKVILVDGFITTAAALLATQLAPASVDFMVFCHESNEQGHRRMLQFLDRQALLNLDLRLGEGTGAALALPLLHAAAKFYNDMASFESAGVTV